MKLTKLEGYMSTKPVDSALPFDIVGQLPEEVTLNIFSRLPADALAAVNEVGWYWNQLTKKEALLNQFDMKTLFKRVSFIDEAFWKAHLDPAKYKLSFNGCCTDQSKIIPKLQKCLSWPIEKIKGIRPGVTQIDVPQGLSIKKLQKLAPRLLVHISDYVIEKYGDIEVDKAYTIIITDNVMEETRQKTQEQQVKIINEYGGERPKAIEIITLLVLTCLNTGKRLYGEIEVVLNGYNLNAWTYTRCEEQITEFQKNKRVVVGHFGISGVHVVINTNDQASVYGLAAVLKV